MKRFRVPPGWPTPPGRSWTPPEGWRPDPSWPAPPDRWRFWVDAKGKPVPGPIGRYGGVSRRTVGGVAAAAALFVAVNVWALGAIGILGGSDKDQAGTLADDARTTPTATAQSTRESIRKPTVIQTETPSGEATPTVIERPRSTSRPTVTETETTEPPKSRHTARPTRTPSYRWSIPPEYIERCKRENPELSWWCDPKNWNR